MARGADIGRTRGLRLQGIGYPEKMITTLVDDHVAALGHVAAYALSGLAASFVMMVGRRVVVGLGERWKPIPAIHIVALCTDRIAFGDQFFAMWLMAVRAGDSLGLHLRLQERAEHVNFVPLLAIGEVEPA